ncbi:hypothetical protein Taro_038168 [Colocasia esculenta]|uniref:Uncharacterized protein n=1 Tax=Colocasia esculenta TaxID=4460 RepID=A0A843WF16_COLES|nr:hypothetical protein [Colocasia esculenta]
MAESPVSSSGDSEAYWLASTRPCGLSTLGGFSACICCPCWTARKVWVRPSGGSGRHSVCCGSSASVFSL